MGKINVLDFEIANLIAAGEVVERPSSVMKELIENSIDSGATEIVAEIKNGGVSLIRVSDNGCGMDKDDLPVAIKRHATSKIRTRDDLDGITTLGFRGEALAAISSVSEVTIITKTAEAESASMLTSSGGKILDISEVGAASGTTVVVENLFFNVPARRKFLKKDSTEAMNVTALIERVALSRPDISVQFSVDGNERFKTPGNSNILDTIYAVLGKDFSTKLILADGEANGVRVHGYIGRSDNVKKNRNLQNIFVNGRYVKSLTAMAALEKAYTSYIAPEAFPVCVLFLEMNPQSVDVNVHPAKLEVKFANEQPVFEAIYYTVKRALEESAYRPEMSLGKPQRQAPSPLSAFVPIGADTKGEQISMINTQKPKSSTSVSDGYIKVASSAPEYKKPTYQSSSFGAKPASRHNDEAAPRMTPKDSVELLERYSKATADSYTPAERVVEPEAPRAQSTAFESVTDYKLVGEAFDCYVMVEYDGALLVIDKHAAHERIIFEDLKRMREADGRVASQSLLLPITALLTPEEQSAADEYSAEISSVGFEFTLGDGYASISAIPDAISAADAEALFIKMTDDIISGRGNPEVTESIRRERALYQIACKAAIKGGRKYDRALIEWLVGRVLALPDVVVCPHGRPIAYRLTKAELDRQFNRIK
ncbi:MAG: DNA mismatch repair endonuclease MutL [Clostridia bacterium]|nr:DNA mismatch repair endonuclease MutL [Clostridia bacterium]